MKLAISSFAWPSSSSEAVLEALGAMALVSGVELVLPMAFADPGKATPKQVERVRKDHERHGLEIPSVQSLAYGKPDLQLFGDQSARNGLLAHLVLMARLSSDLGARTMVFGSPANRLRKGIPMEQATALAVDLFRRLGDAMPEQGLCVTIEPNPPIYSGCDWLNHTAEAAEMVRAVDHPRVKLQLDTGAMVCTTAEGFPHNAIVLASAIELAAHLHVSSPELIAIDPNDAAQERIAAQLLLAEVHQQVMIPWASIEMKHGAPSEDPLKAIERAVRAVIRWYPITPRV